VEAVQIPAAAGRAGLGRPARRTDAELAHLHLLAAYSASLTRLTRAMSRLEPRPGCHRALRVQAMRTAYDQVLLLAAAELEIVTDLQPPLGSADRIALEAELSVAGLRW
jgi:hypothetical protein